ncbi:hypothetical protein Forpi1262_v011029 [Fusarium oxysporum f. sp. raphani]|nr:hypothetical protein Forpi1262_v014079 [Fusarium oxysporum f. sp. raphani]KAG7427690.1 hypothetical protein Forpi1262_v011029 [Fusarium oxysporum f. sp. raphani]
MTTVQVLEQLHTKLTREMWSDKPRVDFLAMVHWLIVKSGGVSHVEIQKTLSSVERIVPELMSQDHAVEPIGNVNIAAVLETLPRSRTCPRIGDSGDAFFCAARLGSYVRIDRLHNIYENSIRLMQFS